MGWPYDGSVPLDLDLDLDPASHRRPVESHFFELLGRPAQQKHFVRLEALGLNAGSELERSLGRRVAEVQP